MAIPVAAKIGGGFFVALGAPVTIYATSDHIFLYSVEREVISKDLKLTVSDPSNKKITISAPSTSSGNDPKLGEGHSWSCEIIVTTTDSNANSSWKTKLEKSLFSSTATSSITDLQRKNKELLVRACSKDRETKTSESVKGKLLAKEEGDSGTKKLLFEQNLELNILLEDESK